MSALAKAVGRTDDGGIVYMSSSDTSSDLIFAHPTLGVHREHFDGPCRKVEISLTSWAVRSGRSYPSGCIGTGSNTGLRISRLHWSGLRTAVAS
jgi:hypothetical protein